MTEHDLNGLAEQAWAYGFPLVFNLDQIARYVPTGVGANPATSFNAFSHADHLATAADTFVSINNDTVYSMGPIDLSVGPVLLQVLDTAGAYYVLQFVDAWTNNFAYVGKRPTGTEAGSYLLTPPGWTGDVPDGAVQIRFPTRVGMIVGRWVCAGPDDLARVRTLQAATTLTPLDPSAPAPTGFPEPDPAVADELVFWEKLRVWTAAFPPAERDRALQDSFGPLGLLDSSSPYRETDAALAAALTSGAKRAAVNLDETQRTGGGAGPGGWRLGIHIGDYNVDFFEIGTIDSPEWKIDDRAAALLARALLARGGLWGNHGYEAAYATTYVDADGEPLTGEHTYTLTLDPPPPAEEFWSLTMYDRPDYYLVDNPIDRYSIGDRTPGLVTGAGGSVTVTIAVDEPTDPSARANWLPAPPGPFRPALRMYIPAADLLDGTYTFPAIVRTAAASG